MFVFDCVHVCAQVCVLIVLQRLFGLTYACSSSHTCVCTGRASPLCLPALSSCSRSSSSSRCALDELLLSKMCCATPHALDMAHHAPLTCHTMCPSCATPRALEAPHHAPLRATPCALYVLHYAPLPCHTMRPGHATPRALEVPCRAPLASHNCTTSLIRAMPKTLHSANKSCANAMAWKLCALCQTSRCG